MTNHNDNPGTALALTHDFMGQIMTPADFNALDELIQKLGGRATTLSPDEKASATEIVETWNKSVVARINANASQASDVLAFLDGKPMAGSMADEIIELFRAVLGDTPEYKAYLEALNHYMAVQGDVPIDEPVDGTMTVAEADRAALANRAARMEHDRDVQVAERRYAKAVKEYIKSLNALPEIQDVRTKLTGYRRKANRMAAECQDKAARAKLNIAISDEETRNILHEMMDFTKTV